MDKEYLFYKSLQQELINTFYSLYVRIKLVLDPDNHKLLIYLDKGNGYYLQPRSFSKYMTDDERQVEHIYKFFEKNDTTLSLFNITKVGNIEECSYTLIYYKNSYEFVFEENRELHYMIIEKQYEYNDEDYDEKGSNFIELYKKFNIAKFELERKVINKAIYGTGGFYIVDEYSLEKWNTLIEKYFNIDPEKEGYYYSPVLMPETYYDLDKDSKAEILDFLIDLEILEIVPVYVNIE